MRGILREWYLYIPPISWMVYVAHYARRREPAYSSLSNWDKIDRNMADVDFNLKIIAGNFIWMVVIMVIGYGRILIFK
ncbi:hypothetical protein LCGC14_1924930 [marine sediment metagenome]|uniref:Uncharacterized protein n=1 Tax=marine sediment metagenome TaxID=412755 RepID=A0A0F9FPK6_9ZZZZ